MAPEFLKEELAAKILSPGNKGLTTENSLLNMNSDSKECDEMKEKIRYNMRELLNIPNDYHIWFCGGGAHLQFAGIPLNFFSGKPE